MARNPEYQFVSTDSNEVVSWITGLYEDIAKKTVKPGSPEKLFLQTIAAIIVQDRVYLNYAANQNLPSRAEGEHLDALGELFYEVSRPSAQPATVTMRFYISEAQSSAVLIPQGTRVTDISSTLYWATDEDVYIPIGSTYADVAAHCLTDGIVGNGYDAGQINTIVDVFPYFDHCVNTIASGNGADEATDDEYYELLMASMDSYSTAGSRGSYLYHARSANNEIGDVAATMPEPGSVNLYVLMKDGTLADAAVKAAVLAACSADDVRPLTDYVQVEDADEEFYTIEFSYYTASNTTTSATEIAAAVANAVEEYVAWQSAKLGRDINPDKLRQLLLATGIKRVVLTSPTFESLKDGSDNSTPQVAVLSGDPVIINGGYEDE